MATETTISKDSIESESVEDYAAEGVPKSVFAALTSGHPVAIHPEAGAKSVDPSNTGKYQTHDAALQALNDWLYEAGGVNAGTVFLPGRPADGGKWVIENTVTWGKDDDYHRVRVRGFGFNRAGAVITTTIDDGSPLFLWTGDTTNGYTIRGVECTGLDFDLGGFNNIAAKFLRCNYWKFQAREIRNIGGYGVIVDSASYDWLIDDTNFVGGDSGGIGIAFRDSLNWQGGGPGDGALGPGVSMMQGFSECVKWESATAKIDVYGHYEGASGRAVLDLGAGSAKAAITQGTHINSSTNGAHAIYHDGGTCLIAPAQISGVDGDGVHIGPDGTGYAISPLTKFNGVTGDAIYVPGEPATNDTTIVPYEETVNGSVTYPEGPWYQLRYPDGKRLQFSSKNQGTVTVAAGGQAALNKHVGNAGQKTADVETWLESDPNAEVSYEVIRTWNNVDKKQRVNVSETSGNAGIEVGYRILTRK